MAMGERMTTTLVERTEVLMDTWRESMRDGVIYLSERRRIDAALEVVYRGTVDVDEATAITVAMLRNGPESQRVERLMDERRSRLRLMGERRSRLRLVVRNDNPQGPQVA